MTKSITQHYWNSQIVQPVKPTDKPRREAQVLHLEKWKADHFANTSNMVEAPEEEQLTQEEQMEIAKFEVWMDKVGQVIAIFAVVATSLLLWWHVFRGWLQ
jgi:hypothetical protein